MVLGWRKAFCSSIRKDRLSTDNSSPTEMKSNPATPKVSSKFGFFSSTPSTPRLQSQPVSSPRLRCLTPPETPLSAPVDLSSKLQCMISKDSTVFSNPSSPRSPSTFSLLKSINALRLCKSTRCGLCLHSVYSGERTAIFTAECSHTFHFPCVAGHMTKQGLLMCPVCNSQWTNLPPPSIHTVEKTHLPEEERKKVTSPSPLSPRTPAYDKHINSCGGSTAVCNLKVYNDDEPLMSSKSGGLFNPIPESDEINEDNEDIVEECEGFFPERKSSSLQRSPIVSGNVQIEVMPDTAVVSVGRGSQTRVIALKIKAPSVPAKITRRAPIDLVAVIDVSSNINKDKLKLIKQIMRMVASSMTAADRLSIVAFSTTSKRLLPFKRMSAAGRRIARRMIEAIVPLDETVPLSAKDALKKAAKVLHDRRERNPASSILLLSNSKSNDEQHTGIVRTTRLPNLEVAVHTICLTKASKIDLSPDDLLRKCLGGLLYLMVQDLRIQLGIVSGSAPGEIAGVYSVSGRSVDIGSGLFQVGDLYADEERELLVELKVPSMCSIGAHQLLSVKTSSIDPSTHKLIQGKQQALQIPPPSPTVRSSNSSIQRLKNRFIITQAVAESRRLVNKNDLASAYQMLSTARAMLLQSRAGSTDPFLMNLESELSELQNIRQKTKTRQTHVETKSNLEKFSEPFTPTSAWKVAERLAKVAMMRKSLNRVSDLHGFENARF